MTQIWDCQHTNGCTWDNGYDRCDCNSGGSSASDSVCSSYQTEDDCYNGNADCYWNRQYGHMGCAPWPSAAYTENEGATAMDAHTISAGVIAAITVSSVLFVGLLCALCIVCYRKRKMKTSVDDTKMVEDQYVILEEVEKNGTFTPKTTEQSGQEQEIVVEVQVNETNH